MKTHQGKLDGRGKRFAVVVSRFHEPVTGKLLDGALESLHANGVVDDDIEVAWVPGAFELPLVARRLARRRQLGFGLETFDGIVCLGAVIRGDTPHFDYVSAEAARGIARVASDTGIPVAFGVLTCDTTEQAFARALPDGRNKGKEAAEACLETVNLVQGLEA